MSEVEEALGRLVASLPGGGESRDGQAQMARAVESAIASGRHLVVRAGTGTGKSFAYLVPALLSGSRVAVATATKALQDQLAEKDLPALEGHLGRAFDAAVLKGRSNYLCRQRLVEGTETGEQGRLGEEPSRAASGERQRQAKAILEWAKVTAKGDRAELSFEVDERVWSAFSVAPDECPGAFRCPSGQSCFAESARQAAAEADLVVVNLHLLGAHLAAGDTVLPEFDILIVDEAHELEEVLTRTLGLSVSPGRLRALAALARSSAAPASRALQQACDALLEVAANLEEVLRARLGQRVLNGNDDQLTSLLELSASTLQRVERALSAGQDEQPAKASRAVLTIGRLREQFDRLGSLDERSVAWVEDPARPTLQIAPIDVSELLGERVFGRCTVVLTSATVPPDLALRLGADPAETDELDVGSPFEFEHNALLYCATHLPDPRRPEAEQAVHDELGA